MLYQHWKEVVTLTNYAVELKNVCKRFPLPTGGELEACKSINITLEKGESLGICLLYTSQGFIIGSLGNWEGRNVAMNHESESLL